MFMHIFSSKESVNVGLGQILGVRFKLKLVSFKRGQMFCKGHSFVHYGLLV